MAQTQERADRSDWYSIKQQRVKYANFWVKKDGNLERPAPSCSNADLDMSRSRQVEPWNVENVNITGKGIEVSQFAGNYEHSDTQKRPKVLTEDQFAWSVLFESGSMKDIRVREMISRPYNESQKATTFIELCFKYEGLPESRDSTRLKTVTPEDAAMEDAEAKGAEADEGECTDEGEEVEGAEAEGGGAEEGVKEVEMEEQEAEQEEEDEEEEEQEEEKVLTPDQFDLAKLFAGPNNFKDLEVRIAFLRSPSKSRPYQWQWPAVFSFLRGLKQWTPQSKKHETGYRVGLPLDDWIKKFGNMHGQSYIGEHQDDGTTKWKMVSASRQPQQSSSSTSTAVPAFGTPLTTAPHPPKNPPAPPQPASTPTPTPSESSQGSKKRILEEIDAEEEEIERGEERLRKQVEEFAVRRRRLREERRQAFQE